jgi:hypothetical protein
VSAFESALFLRYNWQMDPFSTFHPMFRSLVRVRSQSFFRFSRFARPSNSPIEGCGGVKPKVSKASRSQWHTRVLPLLSDP